jgi:hypothetical protein
VNLRALDATIDRMQQQIAGYAELRQALERAALPRRGLS